MNIDTMRERELFEAALSLKEDEREDYLNRACDGDAALRSRIARLLEAHIASEEYFADCRPELVTHGSAPVANDSAATEPAGEMLGSRVGRYKLIRQLGAGGCGVVYLAEQEEPVRRYVALKIIKLGMDTKSVISRFEAERQALALMDHPNIARALDAGATEKGRPYFVMDFVDGVKIVKYCDDHGFDTRQRLSLFILVCNAIQHAHQKGVIHRDIKPSNILVADTDGVPIPKVIDFGIAKATGSSLAENTITLEGQFVGTPAYMSPEQAELGSLDVDTRTDIYSLGVLLYELLTGRTPFEQKELLGSGIFGMRKTLREQEPPKPSRLLTSLTQAELTATAQNRRVEAPRLVKALEGDLDWIVMKALEKDRRRRYATANGFAADVLRYLKNEPVTARPPSRFYRLGKLIQRNKVVWASGTLIVFMLIAGLSLVGYFFVSEREARIEQARLRERADAARVESEQARANEMKLRKEAEAREKVTQATVLMSHGQTDQADALLDPYPPELFTPSTEATTVFRELGTWNILKGRWQQAANRYLVLVKVNQVDRELLHSRATFDLLVAAPLLIETGDMEGYNRLRHQALLRLKNTPYPDAAEQLLKTSLIIPADPDMMRSLESLVPLMTNSLQSYQPPENAGWYAASWRAMALGLWYYRDGHYDVALDWLKKSSDYPDQSDSCVAAIHLLRSLTLYKLNQKDAAEIELAKGHELVKAYFGKKLEQGHDKSGRFGGWIMNCIFLREAMHLVRNDWITNFLPLSAPETDFVD